VATDTNDLAGAEVAVVGGGPAGLSAALQLARYKRRVLVFDTGQGRSTHHQTNRNYLGFPDGVATTELRALGRRQLAPYPHVRFAAHRVTAVVGDGAPGFHGPGAGPRLVGQDGGAPPPGVLDHFPHFPGLEGVRGRVRCLGIACDGYENRGRRILVVDTPTPPRVRLCNCTASPTGSAAHQQPQGRHQPALQTTASPRRGVPIRARPHQGGEGTAGRLRAIVTRAARRIALDALFSVQGGGATGPGDGRGPRSRRPAHHAGLCGSGRGAVHVGPRRVRGGDITAPHAHQVSAAVQEGAQAASAANYFLYPPELKAD